MAKNTFIFRLGTGLPNNIKRKRKKKQDRKKWANKKDI